MSLNEQVVISLNRYEQLMERNKIKELEDINSQLEAKFKKLADNKLVIINNRHWDHLRISTDFLGCNTDSDVIQAIQKILDEKLNYTKEVTKKLEEIQKLENKWYIKFFKMFSKY